MAGGLPARAGDFKKDYLRATQLGTWSQFQLTAQDGSASTYTYEGGPTFTGSVTMDKLSK